MLKLTSPRRETLPTGGLLVTERVPGVRSAALGVWVRAGSRDEPAGIHGISHFIEHMMFKGTARRSAHEIARSLDGVGGLLDAYTSREYTCYFARVLDEHLALAFDVIGDCLSHSRFDPEHVEREKQVVAEEIRSDEDAPEDYAAQRLSELVWRGHPLGTSVLGTRETVRSFTSESVRHRFEQTYGGAAVVVAAAGSLEHERVRELVLDHLDLPADVAPPRRTPVPLVYEAAELAVERDLRQLTIAIGAPGLPVADPRRPALELLNALLGGSLSSRIFQRVREEEGLAYSVYTDIDCYHDAGLFMCSMGVSPETGRRALRLVADEFASLCRDGLCPGELDAMKAQWKGSLLMGLESTTQRLGRLARNELYHGRDVPIGEEAAAIERVTADEVVEVACEILRPERFSIVALGPRLDGPLGRDDLDWG